METYKKFNLFAGDVEIILYDIDPSLAEGFFEDIYQEAIRLQKIFNFYDKKGELSKLNKRRKINASTELLTVIKKAIKYCELTNGRYDISKANQIIARKNSLPLPNKSCSYKDIHIKNDQISLGHPDVLIDLGSIAKGYIVDKLVEFMQNQGIESAYIDARGDMRIFGDHEELVEIQDPRDHNSTIGSIQFKNQAIATSGDYKQYNNNDFNSSHLLGKEDLISVTVIADNLTLADVLATCICLLKQNEVNQFISQFTNTEIICINNKLEKINFSSKKTLDGDKNVN